MASTEFPLAELATLVSASTALDDDTPIRGIASLASAKQGDISFLANKKFLDQLERCQASAVLVTAEQAAYCPTVAVVVSNPYLAYAQLTAFFVPEASRLQPGIAASASVADTAKLPSSAAVAANVSIAKDVVIGDNVQLHSGVVIGAGARIGNDTIIYPNVTVYHEVEIGQGCVIHANSSIGADGFGFAPNGSGGWVKIHQLGSVHIGDRVELGAGCTVDRGALGNTVIENGVIIDDQVHIAHNVFIGENTGIAGATAIAGSTSIGKNCTIAGAVGIVGHLEIADNVHITAMSLVTHSIKEPGAYSSGTAMSANKAWRRNAVRFNQLDDMYQRLRRLENKKD